jgi:methyl-accepting chemotaxis protein
MPSKDNATATPIMASTDQQEAITDIAGRIGDLSISFAGVSGNIEDTSVQVKRQSELFQDIANRAKDMTDATSTVLNSAQKALQTSADAENTAQQSQQNVSEMVTSVGGLIDDVRRMAEQLSRLEESLALVGRFSSEIDAISRKTNLLSLNAAIEAARAGEHGRGFMIVAKEVKDLSGLTSEATSEISDTLEKLGKELMAVKTETTSALEKAGGIRTQIDLVGSLIEQMPVVMSDLNTAQREIVSASSKTDNDISEIQTRIIEMSSGMSQSSSNLAEAGNQMREIIESSEAIIGMTSRLGVETVDTPFIRAVQDLAQRIGERFEKGVRLGEIGLHELFDTNHKPIPGSDPVQYMTRFVRFTDAVLPEFQEPMLLFSDRVVFCACVDKKGFLPTHNDKFSMPQVAGQPEWNAANSRNRRIFNDRVGLAAGNSERPFLLQAYRRDMGNGRFALMKDLSAPIFVEGRHWGGVRLAYHV